LVVSEISIFHPKNGMMISIGEPWDLVNPQTKI
jgi:hypothetical protein